MQFTKPMIELVFEIRRRVDAQMKPGIKLANPDLLVELAAVHHHSKDTILRTLIKELLTVAGDEWLSLLQQPGQAPGKMMVKAYRGQVSLEAAPADRPSSGETGTNSVRYYRGVRVTA